MIAGTTSENSKKFEISFDFSYYKTTDITEEIVEYEIINEGDDKNE